MMGIQDYDCPQESVLIDTHEGYVSSDRKKTRKRKIAQFINLLLIGLGRPLADIFCKVIPHPGPIPNCLAVDHWLKRHLSKAERLSRATMIGLEPLLRKCVTVSIIT